MIEDRKAELRAEIETVAVGVDLGALLESLREYEPRRSGVCMVPGCGCTGRAHP